MTSQLISAARSGILRSTCHIKGVSQRGTFHSIRQIDCRTLSTSRVLSSGESKRNYVNRSSKSSHELSSSGKIKHNEIHKTKFQSSNSYIICNHGLAGLGASVGDKHFIERLLPCGNCNVIGNYEKIHVRAHDTEIPWSSDHVSRSGGLSSLSRYSPLLSTNPADTNWLVIRTFHSSSILNKEESKAEQTVKALKEEAKHKSETTEIPPTEKTEAQQTVIQETKSPITPDDATTAVAPPKKSIKERVIAEMKHYYHGFRLLFIDIKVAIRLMWMLLNGKSLSRRERKQLVRTTADIFRLVPFLVFVIVPFMEFLLPVALKLFPGMLPSTFAEANKEQEKLRKRFKVKLEMAKFLQDTIEQTALTRKGAKGESVQEFVQFMEKIRTSGEQTSNVEIIKYSKLFDEDITLDNLNYGQLRALLKLLDVPAVGTSNFLRFKLRMKLRQLEADDRMIMKEGMDSLAVWELQDACRARGMRALGVPKERLGSQLSQWLDLHLNEQIPTSLLLLSRTLYLPEQLSTEEQLKATISALPETTAEEAKIKISEVTGDRVDHKTKLDIIRQEEEAIKKEAEEEEAKRAAEEAKRMEDEARREEEEELVDSADAMKEPPDVIKAAAEAITPSIVDSMPPKPEETFLDNANMNDIAEWSELQKEKDKKQAEISKEDLEEIEDVLGIVAEEKAVHLDQEELEAFKEDVSEYKEAIEDLQEVVLASWGNDKALQESKSAKRLSKSVFRLVSQMDGVMSDLYKEKSQLMEDIEIKEVKIKRSTELMDDKKQVMLDQIKEKKRNLVSINELVLAMRRIQKVPDETKLQRIAQVLDEDSDGVIDISDAMKVIELIGRENVSVEAEHMTEIMDLLRREEVIEQEEKQEKIREKLEKQEQKQTQDTEQLTPSDLDTQEISTEAKVKEQQQQKQ